MARRRAVASYGGVAYGRRDAACRKWDSIPYYSRIQFIGATVDHEVDHGDEVVISYIPMVSEIYGA